MIDLASGGIWVGPKGKATFFARWGFVSKYHGVGEGPTDSGILLSGKISGTWFDASCFF